MVSDLDCGRSGKWGNPGPPGHTTVSLWPFFIPEQMWETPAWAAGMPAAKGVNCSPPLQKDSFNESLTFLST